MGLCECWCILKFHIKFSLSLSIRIKHALDKSAANFALKRRNFRAFLPLTDKSVLSILTHGYSSMEICARILWVTHLSLCSTDEIHAYEINVGFFFLLFSYLDILTTKFKSMRNIFSMPSFYNFKFQNFVFAPVIHAQQRNKTVHTSWATLVFNTVTFSMNIRRLWCIEWQNFGTIKFYSPEIMKNAFASKV